MKIIKEWVTVLVMVFGAFQMIMAAQGMNQVLTPEYGYIGMDSSFLYEELTNKDLINYHQNLISFIMGAIIFAATFPLVMIDVNEGKPLKRFLLWIQEKNFNKK